MQLINYLIVAAELCVLHEAADHLYFTMAAAQWVTSEWLLRFVYFTTLLSIVAHALLRAAFTLV
jgi:hypothetical protein